MLMKAYRCRGKDWTLEELALELRVPYYDLRRLVIADPNRDLEATARQIRYRLYKRHPELYPTYAEEFENGYK